MVDPQQIWIWGTPFFMPVQALRQKGKESVWQKIAQKTENEVKTSPVSKVARFPMRQMVIVIAVAVVIVGFWWFGVRYVPVADTELSAKNECRKGGATQAHPMEKYGEETHPCIAISSNLPKLECGVEFFSEQEVCQKIDRLVSGKEYEQALAKIEELLAKDCDAAVKERLLLYKGNLLFSMGKLDDAYAVYRDLLIQGERDDIRNWATVKLYAVAKNLGRVDETIAEFQTLYSNNSADSRVGLILADLYAYKGATEKETEIRKILLNDKANLEENGQRLIAAYKKGQAFANAAETAQFLAQNDADHAAYYYLQQAQLLTLAKNSAAAVEACGNVVNSAGANAQTLLRCGYLYEQLGKSEQAMAAFSKGAETATEQHRQERCRVEELRLKKQQEILSSDDLQTLKTLAQSAKAEGVRTLAGNLLNSHK